MLVQAIESRGTQISYAALLYAMTEALEQLAASQGKLPPKLPAEMSGLFGGMLDRLVRFDLQKLVIPLYRGSSSSHICIAQPHCCL